MMTGSGNGSSSFIQGNSTYIIACSEAIAAVFLRKRFLKWFVISRQKEYVMPSIIKSIFLAAIWLIALKKSKEKRLEAKCETTDAMKR